LYTCNIENELKKEIKELKRIIEKSCLVDFDGNYICNNESMSNVICNLKEEQYLSYTCGSIMVNEYNNPILLICMFPTLFPYRLSAPKMTCQKIKVSIKAHVKYLMNLDDKDHGFAKLIPFLSCLISFNLNKFVWVHAKLTI
jgi:hypothetical protein